ncbi:hypothetical protein F5878DRAFT_648150 [Lentinula raphanica]|uniref:Retrotransposon gag domain-containing protein n=1 Tax=Lentinula raphanica TaxID=153919 RepID=A0AA38NUI2_9AGAR|nr:hypothetical protein F5878DRAFT_648150 [Lentinula raphanica]
MKRERLGQVVPPLIQWEKFAILFGQMFGLHYETIQAQSKLDECLQAWNESFGDFWVRFEDIALMTEYDDHALRSNQTTNSATSIMPPSVPNGTASPVNSISTTLTQPKISSTTPRWPKTNIRTAPTNQAVIEASDVKLESSIAEESVDNGVPKEQDKPYPKVSQEEWNHRMREGLCGICGSKEHRYHQHFNYNGQPNATLRGAFIQEHNFDDGPYVEIDGFEEPVHINDPILDIWSPESN